MKKEAHNKTVSYLNSPHPSTSVDRKSNFLKKFSILKITFLEATHFHVFKETKV